jgi:hypothetical protein
MDATQSAKIVSGARPHRHARGPGRGRQGSYTNMLVSQDTSEHRGSKDRQLRVKGGQSRLPGQQMHPLVSTMVA